MCNGEGDFGNPEVDNQLDQFYESYRKSLAHLYT